MVFGYEEQLNVAARMQLTDLAQMLSRNPAMQIETAYASFYDNAGDEDTIGISQFWSSYSDDQRLTGQKSDVYLRAAGSVHYTDAAVVARFLADVSSEKLPQSAKQIAAIGEEARLERCVLQD